MSNNGRIVWIDLEMTGLEPERYWIMEIATIVTDFQLNVIAQGPELIIRQSADHFHLMDEWNRNQHTKSGLWQKAIASDVSLQEAEEKTLAFLKQHVAPRAAPLAGNTIWQDRRFLCRQMPQLEAHLHYRTIDVSSIKQLVNNWYPPARHYSVKKDSHRALDDIRESIAELAFYKSTFFRTGEELPAAPDRNQAPSP